MSLRDITLGQVADLQVAIERIPKGETWLGSWRTLLREFRDKHGLSDRDANDISRFDLGGWKEKLCTPSTEESAAVSGSQAKNNNTGAKASTSSDPSEQDER